MTGSAICPTCIMRITHAVVTACIGAAAMKENMQIGDIKNVMTVFAGYAAAAI